jgi:hypothetical protein
MITDADWKAIDSIPGYMSRDECDWLATLAVSVSSWTEIGVYAGRSMFAVGLYLPPCARLQLVDPKFQAGFNAVLTELKGRRTGLDVRVWECDSTHAAGLMSESDVVFVDGSHDYADVCDDIRSWKPKCSTLCGHDYHSEWPGVFRAVNELCGTIANPVGTIWVCQ